MTSSPRRREAGVLLGADSSKMDPPENAAQLANLEVKLSLFNFGSQPASSRQVRFKSWRQLFAAASHANQDFRRVTIMKASFIHVFSRGISRLSERYVNIINLL